MRKTIILLLSIGFALFAYSLTLPFYTDQNAKDNLDHEASEENYYSEIEKIKTQKVFLMDLGSGIIIASATILLFLFQQNIKNYAGLKKSKSMKKGTMFILSNCIWLILIPGTFWYYTFRSSRGDYPWFADSIGIPLMQTVPLIFFGLIPLNLFLFLTSFKSNFPTTLFKTRVEYTWKQILLEVFWGSWILLNLLILVEFIIDGDHISIPINIFFTYILLTLRSGQMNEEIVEIKSILIHE